MEKIWRTCGWSPASLSRCWRALHFCEICTSNPSARLGTIRTGDRSRTTRVMPGSAAAALSTSCDTAFIPSSSIIFWWVRAMTTWPRVAIVTGVAGASFAGHSAGGLAVASPVGATGVLDAAHRRRERFRAIRMLQRLATGDETFAEHLEQVLVKGLHAALATFDVLAELVELALMDVLLRDGSAAEQLDRGATSAAALRHNQPLRDDRLERMGELGKQDLV